jgi:hypothetical protein
MARKASNRKIRMHFTLQSNRVLPPLAEMLARRKRAAASGAHLPAFTPSCYPGKPTGLATTAARNGFARDDG